MTNGQSLGTALGALLGWLATGRWRVPLPWFLPLESRFVWATGVRGVGIDLFGRGLWMVVLALGGFLLGHFAQSSRAHAVLAWLVLGAFAVCLFVELVGT